MELPFEVGPQFEGERIRKKEMYAELGGPKVALKCELVKLANLDDIEDGKVTLRGLDIKDMEEGTKSTFVMFMEVAGEKLEEDMEGVIERKTHEYCNFIEGFMHLNQRSDIWCRVSKDAIKKGFTLTHFGTALLDLFKTEWNLIEKMQITIITDETEAKKVIQIAKESHEARDKKTRDLKESDVEEFYSCLMCQSFAPPHVCVITPERKGLCGAISWIEARAASKADSEGAMVPVIKGKVLDKEKGEYEGVNALVVERSGGDNERFYLHSMFGFPHTSCGCFESLAFYIPEVDGIGIVHRDFTDETPVGVPFSRMASQTGGGEQTEGILGIAMDYMRSSKFLQADGGWNRIVWLPSTIKEIYKDAIPEDIFNKIATEETVKDTESLKSFLEKATHPVTQRWDFEITEEMESQFLEYIKPRDEIYLDEVADVIGITKEQIVKVANKLKNEDKIEGTISSEGNDALTLKIKAGKEDSEIVTGVKEVVEQVLPTMTGMQGIPSGSFKIVLKNAKIHINQIIIRKK